MIVAVTGATGYVGRFIVEELQQQGVDIRAWCRPGTRPKGFTEPIQWINGNLRSPQAMKALVHGADAVVHAAFEHEPGRYRGGEGEHLDAFLVANLLGSLRLLEACRQAEVQRFLFLSSRAVFGRAETQPEVDEARLPQPDTHYGACKTAVEAFLSSWTAQGLSCCSLRATGVYGLTFPEEQSKWFSLVHAVLQGEPCAVRGGTEVHGRDVARAAWLLLKEPAASGNVYHCSDLYLTTRDIAHTVQKLSGSQGPLPAVPVQPSFNMLNCQKLRNLGWQPGGLPLFAATVQQLIELAEGYMRSAPSKQ
jgi:nucleoside-diphosphate-sugar epimerase